MTPLKLATDSLCPCGRHRLGRVLRYSQCCGLYLDQGALAPDAESLMRSRYTAFVRERADYLLATWQADTRPLTLEFEPGVKWLGLDVRGHWVRDDSHAEVEFVARQKSSGSPALRLHERSRFVREARAGDGLARWYYLDGEQQQEKPR